jgi:hypothetical protein
MATCPYCRGHLTDGHRCPRRPVFVAIELVASAVAGGLAGLLLLAAFDPRGQITDMDGVAIVMGALIGLGINRFVRS